ncbi:hypothetical protein C0991_006426 [Blastosporella zonata]|nr:hypothetical protein C0991_006426 [Blastosporella zonata]
MLRAPQLKSGVNIMETTALVGAIFNANLQIGSSLGLAIVTAVTAEVGQGDLSNFTGYKAGWWFVVALAGFEALLAAVFLRAGQPPTASGQKGADSVDTINEKLDCV